MSHFVVYPELSRISTTSTKVQTSKYKPWDLTQVQTSKHKPKLLPTVSSPVLTDTGDSNTSLHPDSLVFPYSLPHISRREPIDCGIGKKKSGRLHEGGCIRAGPCRVSIGGKEHSRKTQPHQRCD